MIPSIDLQGGQAVQLVGGKQLAIEAGDPFPLAERFSLAGEMAVIDLDAAMGKGSNRALMEQLVARFPCRVGGGIRDEETARRWLDLGAQKVILGTAATPELLSRLPRERVIAALDGNAGEVVVEGWTKATGLRVLDRIAELRDLVGGFLVTFVEREGRMQGMDLDQVREVVAAAGDRRVTVAGGIAQASEIGVIDHMGADAQIGMALYSGKMDLADAIAAPLQSDRSDGLWPTVVCDESGIALGLCWSNIESLREAIRTQRGVYHSRKRGLWRKGESSGNGQELVRVTLDCDRDCLRFTVRQHGAGFCHEPQWTCWGDEGGVAALLRRLQARCLSAPAGSYTARLLGDRALLKAKLQEEAGELDDAEDRAHVAEEAADLLYFTLTAVARARLTWAEVERVLNRRALKLTRRPGNAKT